MSFADPKVKAKIGDIRYREGKKRRETWLQVFRETGSLQSAHAGISISTHTYRSWRQKYPDFAFEVDAVKAELKAEAIQSGAATLEQWRTAGFVARRKEFFGFTTPWFQQKMIQGYLEAPLGNIEMQLIAPEHGKTTLFEDYASDTLSIQPSHRFTVGSESQTLARKILNRVKIRMDPEGPIPHWVKLFGPFVPQTKAKKKVEGIDEGRATRQPWGADFFSVYGKSSFDERDYSMEARGIGGQIAGTRTDHLHLDDVTSLNNLTETEKNVAKFRQDWLSRPGERGITTIAGTRVAEGDFYETIENEIPDHILHVTRYPAIIRDPEDGHLRPLWPKEEGGYTMEELDRMREKVGESAWWRNYMQKPKAARLGTFTEESVMRCANKLISVTHRPKPENGPLIIGWDPSIGGVNCFAVCQMAKDHMFVWEIREDNGLQNNQQMFHVLEQLLIAYSTTGCVISDVVIEATHFQKGLIQDQDLLHLRKRFGFSIHGHVTNKEKYDENIGIPAMATDIHRQAIEFCYADDPLTRHMFDEWIRQLCVWEPHVKGSRQRMDQVMATWFCWLIWSKRRKGSLRKTTEVKGQGLDWTPTKALVLVGGEFSYR